MTKGKPSIFFSYSWRDMPISMRIYDDLVRSGLTVWRDQVTGTYGFDFAMEIEEKIAECDGFLLIDSRNARSGQWVGEECKIFEKLGGRKTKTLSICLVEDNSLVFTDDYPEMLTNQNTIKYFDFSTRGVLFDNENKYQEEIKKLCEFWNAEFQGYSLEDEAKDFEDEISQVEITAERKNLILQQFKLNLERHNLNYPYVGMYGQALVQECEDCGIASSAPMFMYGIYHANRGGFLESERIFKKATETFPYDTRCWRAYGGSLSKLGKHTEATKAFKRAIELIEAMRDGNTEVFPKVEMVKYNVDLHVNTLEITQSNLAASFFHMKEYEKSLALFYKVFQASSDFRPPELFLGISDCLEALENYQAQEVILFQALHYYPSNPRVHEELGQLYFKTARLEESVWHYEFLYKRDIQNIQTLADYLFILKLIGHPDFNSVSKDVLAKSIFKTPSDKYNLGHILYMNGRIQESKMYYQDAKLEEPFYKELWDFN